MYATPPGLSSGLTGFSKVAMGSGLIGSPISLMLGLFHPDGHPRGF